MGFVIPLVSLFSDVMPAIKLNSITVTVTVNIATDVTYVHFEGGGAPCWEERVTQNLSWTKTVTAKKVAFSAVNLTQFYNDGTSLIRSTVGYADLSVDEFSFYKVCCVPFPCMVSYLDLNYLNAGGVTWFSSGEFYDASKISIGGGPGGSQWLRYRHYPDDIANDWHSVNTPSAGSDHTIGGECYGIDAPANSNDTSLLTPYFYTELIVGLPSDGSLANFNFFLGWTGTHTPDFSGLPAETTPVAVHPFTWGDPAHPASPINFGGTISKSEPPPSGAGVTVHAWTYDLTCVIGTG